MAWTMLRAKNLIDKNPKAKSVYYLLHQWIKAGVCNPHQFAELMNYSRLAISKTGKQPYTGNEDPELIMG